VNGGFYKAQQITVIAAYAAQKVLLENQIRSQAKCEEVRVSTVDGYQGEENDIILLSLVRNNDKNGVGFLKTDNRVCVALSRARHGLFMIGNMSCLKAESETWNRINDILVEMKSIGSILPAPGFKPKPLESFSATVPKKTIPKMKIKAKTSLPRAVIVASSPKPLIIKKE